jgi:hypothetical protein
MSVDIVVAKYDEDTSWTRKLPDAATICVYDKGCNGNMDAIALPNVGREGHTFLTHIVTRYDCLADVTVFLQGRIDDHLSCPTRAVRDWIEQVARQGHTTPAYAVATDYAFRHTTYFGKRLWPSDACFGDWFVRNVGAFPTTPTIPFYKNGLFGVS